jgi:hypothetical protein
MVFSKMQSLGKVIYSKLAGALTTFSEFTIIEQIYVSMSLHLIFK